VSSILAKIIRNAIEKRAYKVGSKEVLKHILNARLIICSNSLNKDVLEKINEASKARDGNNDKSDTPLLIYHINKNSVELGRLIGKPFRVSIISIEDVDKEDLDTLAKEIQASNASSHHR